MTDDEAKGLRRALTEALDENMRLKRELADKWRPRTVEKALDELREHLAYCETLAQQVQDALDALKEDTNDEDTADLGDTAPPRPRPDA